MNINYKEPQFELFPANSASLEDINKPRFLLASLTLTTESLVILVILAIMIALFSFSIGVERGKHLVAQALDEKVSAAWTVGNRHVAVAPAVAAVSTATVNPHVVNRAQVSRPVLNTNVVRTPVAKAAIAPKVTTAPVAAASATAGKWTVQLSTYKSENYAQQEALGLKSKGYPVFLVKFKDYYLVCVGQFASQEQADAFSKRFPAKKQGSQVRRI